MYILVGKRCIQCIVEKMLSPEDIIEHLLGDFPLYTSLKIEQKGMTFNHVFCYFILLFSSLFLGGKRKGKRITKVLVKSHTFLLDHQKMSKF